MPEFLNSIQYSSSSLNFFHLSIKTDVVISSEPKPESLPTALPFIQNFETDYYSGINEQEEVLEDILEVSNKKNQSTVEDTSEIESFLIENTCPKSRGCRCVCDDLGNN